MIMKTLFVQIDNTSLPMGGEDYVLKLDCRQIYEFLTFVGYVLIGDLKNGNGIPYYRVLKDDEFSQIVSGYQYENEIDYSKIIDQWFNIYSDIIQIILKNIHNKYENDRQNGLNIDNNTVSSISFNIDHSNYKLLFSETYINWLLNNNNELYKRIGCQLLKNKGYIYLDGNELIDEIISVVFKKISKTINDNTDLSIMVLSNSNVCDSILKAPGKTEIELFLKDDNAIILSDTKDFFEYIKKEFKYKCLLLEDHRAFVIDQYILGVTQKKDMEFLNADNSIYYKDVRLFFLHSPVLDSIYTIRNDEGFNSILSLLNFGCEINNEKRTFADIHQAILKPHNFKEVIKPHMEWDELGQWFKAEYLKDNPTYECKLSFLKERDLDIGWSGLSLLNYYILEAEGTLYSIYIRLK